MINLLLLNNFCHSDVTPTSSKGKENDQLLYTGLVTRYGPQSVAKRRRANVKSLREKLQSRSVPALRGLQINHARSVRNLGSKLH